MENKKIWARKKLEVKQLGIEEEENTMSRHLDAVVTLTLHQKQSRHHIISSREKVATSVRGRDSSSEEKRSRQHLVVATTSGCRDNNSTERKSQHHLKVATTVVKKEGRDNI